MAQGIEAIKQEVEAHPDDPDGELKECLDYVLNKPAGKEDGGGDDRVFPNGRRDEDMPEARRIGQDFTWFCKHKHSVESGLSDAQVLALRLYTTAAYKYLNTPLRDQSEERGPHPMPATVTFLSEGIKKLRTVEAVAAEKGKKSKQTHRDLWRGMRGLVVDKHFMADGGTEQAPMSTTDDLKIAVQYSSGTNQALLFKLSTSSFMQRGADLQYLSAFPKEKEFLFPPLTFMQPTGRKRKLTVGQGQVAVTVVEVEPQMG